MARKKAQTTITEEMTVFTQADYDKLTTCTENILNAQRASEGLAQTIASNLFIVSQNKLYELEDYKTVHDWAMEKFDISKGTVSDSINTFARFGDGNTGKLLEKWENYQFSTLMRIKKFSDEEIEQMGIDFTLSRAQVIAKIDSFKEAKALQDKLPILQKEWQDILKEFYEVVQDTEERVNILVEILPEYADTDRELTGADLEKLITGVEAFLDGVKEEQTEDSSTAEQSETTEDSSTAEQEQNTSSKNEQETVDSDETMHTFPTRTLNLSDFTDPETGYVIEKDFMKVFRKMFKDILNSDYDVVITK